VEPEAKQPETNAATDIPALLEQRHFNLVATLLIHDKIRVF
jgi:hypothetical protein